MSRGNPDYGNYNMPVSLSDVNNNAVMTALLGFSPIDYRGQAVFINTFKQGGEGWSGASFNGGTDPRLVSSPSPVFNSPLSYAIRSSVVGGSSKITKSFIMDGLSSVGFEAGICLVSDSGTADLTIVYDVPNGSLLSASLRFNQQLGRFYYYNSSGTYTHIEELQLSTGTLGGWIQFKVVLDIEKKQYKRVVFAGRSVDLAGVSCKINNTISAGAFTAQINTEAIDAANVEKVWCGYAIITRDE